MNENPFKMPKEKRAKYLLSLHRKAERKPADPLSPLFVQIGEALREKRKSRNLTLKGLQDISGIDRGNICRIEQGVKKTEVAVLERLAKALGCRLSVEFIRSKETVEK